MSNLLTQSRLSTARTCQRLHHLKYNLGYRALVEIGVLRFGTLIHAGLEAWWRAKMRGASAEECLAAALAAVQVEEDVYARVLAEVLLVGYHVRWFNEPYEVLAVEVQFDVELRNPTTGAASRTWRLAGKIDVVVRDLRTGLVCIIEHKTSSEDITPGSVYWKRLRMDPQVSVYFKGGISLGYDVARCVYDVLGKPGQRPSAVPIVDDGAKVVLDANGERVRTKDGKKWRETGDTALGYVVQTRPETADEYKERLAAAVAAEPDRYFARGDVVRLEEEMNDALVDVWQLGQQMRENQLADRHPRNPGSCMQWGRTCSFFDVCSGAADINDPALFARSENVHPELAQEAQPQETPP